MNKVQFSSFPLSARLGIVFTISAWVFSILSQAVMTSTISLVPITLALVCGVVVYSLKPWGRIFCVIFNILMMANNVYALVSPPPAHTASTLPTGVCLINILLFALATFFLMHRDTAAFYKQQKPLKTAP